MENKRLVYTPNLRIPVGEAIKRLDGSHAIRIKNPRTNKFDEITLDALIEEVVQKSAVAENRTDAQDLASI